MFYSFISNFTIFNIEFYINWYHHVCFAQWQIRGSELTTCSLVRLGRLVFGSQLRSNILKGRIVAWVKLDKLTKDIFRWVRWVMYDHMLTVQFAVCQIIICSDWYSTTYLVRLSGNSFYSGTTQIANWRDQVSSFQPPNSYKAPQPSLSKLSRLNQ